MQLFFRLATASLLLMSALPACAADSNGPFGPSPAQVPKFATGALTLIQTKLVTSDFSGTYAAGTHAVDGVTHLYCPVACTIAAELSVQVSGTQSHNAWAVCAKVDDSFMPFPYCPWLGMVPVDERDTRSMTLHTFPLQPGAHTVQTLVFTQLGATIGAYAINYRTYK